MKDISNFNKLFLKIFKRTDQTIFNENPIIALLKGPDARYEKILMNENEQFNTFNANIQGREKNSFLQIHVRKLISKDFRVHRVKKFRYGLFCYNHKVKRTFKDKCLLKRVR